MRRQNITIPPTIASSTWALSIDGTTRQQKLWTYSVLCSLPTQSIDYSLICTAETTSPAVRTVRGIAIGDLLAEVEPLAGTDYAQVVSADGYATVLPFDALRRGFLALWQDDQPLTPEDGFPARLVIPNLAGYKQAKWVTRISLGQQPALGFWESRGWSIDGEIAPRAWLNPIEQHVVVGQTVQLSGEVFGANTVYISVDDSDPMPVQVTAHTASGVGLWYIDYTPQHAGKLGIRVSMSPVMQNSNGTFRKRRRSEGVLEVRA